MPHNGATVLYKNVAEKLQAGESSLWKPSSLVQVSVSVEILSVSQVTKLLRCFSRTPRNSYKQNPNSAYRRIVCCNWKSKIFLQFRNQVCIDFLCNIVINHSYCMALVTHLDHWSFLCIIPKKHVTRATMCCEYLKQFFAVQFSS